MFVPNLKTIDQKFELLYRGYVYTKYPTQKNEFWDFKGAD